MLQALLFDSKNWGEVLAKAKHTSANDSLFVWYPNEAGIMEIEPLRYTQTRNQQVSRNNRQISPLPGGSCQTQKMHFWFDIFKLSWLNTQYATSTYLLNFTDPNWRVTYFPTPNGSYFFFWSTVKETKFKRPSSLTVDQTSLIWFLWQWAKLFNLVSLTVDQTSSTDCFEKSQESRCVGWAVWSPACWPSLPENGSFDWWRYLAADH